MNFLYDKRKIVMRLSFVLWLVIQVFLVIKYWNLPQYSDAKLYMDSAMECYMGGQWYPNIHQLNSQQYLFNPGFINFLILELNVFGTFMYHGIIGIGLNLILLASVRKIIEELVNDEASDYATILYCLMYSNMISSIPVMSDLFFTCLLFGSLALLRPKYIWLVLSSMIMCYANYTRPLLVIFVASILFYMYFKNFGWKRIVVYCLSYFVFSTVLSLIISSNTAAKDASGSTLGVNLIMGANNHMNGTVNDEVFKKGDIGYIEKNTNVYQKDSIWQSHAIKWIAQHPVKYVSYVPIKMVRLWWGDNYMDLPLNNLATSNTSLYSKLELCKRAFRIVGFSLFYYITFFLMLIGLWKLRKKIWGYWGVFVLPIILACGMHCVLYGGMRYHYSYVPIMILYATIGLMSFKDKKLLFLTKKKF